MHRVGLYPGTFDPPTNGHLDIIGRARKLVDTLIIGVAINEAKKPLFPLQERVDIETVFLMADVRHQAVASRLVKEIASLGGDITPFVTPDVKRALLEKYEK